MLLGCIALAALTSIGAEKRAYVIQNAKVYTMAAAGTLERASVVIQDGKIAAVGAAVKARPGALRQVVIPFARATGMCSLAG